MPKKTMHKVRIAVSGATPGTDRAQTWCGKDVPASHATKPLTGVGCVQCREAFAAFLKAQAPGPEGGQ